MFYFIFNAIFHIRTQELFTYPEGKFELNKKKEKKYYRIQAQKYKNV